MAYPQPVVGTPLNLAHPLAPSVAAWAINEGSGSTVTDSKSSLVGTLTNMDPATDWVAGPGGSDWCLDFDGVDDRVNVLTAAALNPTNAITLHALIRPASATDISRWPRVVSKLTGSPFNGYEFMLPRATGAGYPHKLWFQIGTGTASPPAAQSAGVLPAAQWLQVTGTYDRSNIIVYVDGSPGTPVVATAAIGVSTQPLQFAHYPPEGGVGSSHWNGRIGGVWLWSTALSQAQITTLVADVWAMWYKLSFGRRFNPNVMPGCSPGYL